MHPGRGWTGRVTRLAAATAAAATTAAAVVFAVTASSARDDGPAPDASAGDGSSALLVQGAGPGTSAVTDRVAGGTTSTTPSVLLRSRVTRVAGHLSDVRRERVSQHAHAAVLAVMQAASDEAERPWRGFVRGLRAEARTDAPVLRGSGEPGPVEARAWFSVAAPYGRPVGVTARVAVTLPSDEEGPASLTGRLLLTRHPGGAGPAWQVFGYDLARGTR